LAYRRANFEQVYLANEHRMSSNGASQSRNLGRSIATLYRMSQWTIALRQLLRRPGFAFTAVVLLAGGIAANTTVFSLFSTIFLKPLRYPDADRLVYVYEANTSKQEPTSLMAPVRIEDWNRLNQTFTAIAGYNLDTQTDRTGNAPERLRAFSVSPRYFAVYGAKPLVGRTFNNIEEIAGGPNTVILSYSLWTRRFNRSPRILGQRLRLGSEAYTVIGVMPSAFVSPTVDIWLPARFGSYLTHARDARFYTGVGRLKPGVTLQQAQRDLAGVQRQLGQDFPQTDRGWSSVVFGMKETVIGDHGRFVWIAFSAVGILMLLACTNIAGLMLAHLQRRRNELAVRTSLGASRRQLVATILREVSVLAVAGIAVGMLASSWIISALTKILTTLPRISELQLDWRSLAFASTLGALTVLIVGLIPALQASRSGFAITGLCQGGRTETGNRHSLQQALLAIQFSITVVLLVSAGLLLRSYRELTRENAGFSRDHVLTFHVGAEWGEDRTAIGKLQNELIAALGNSPGVIAAGITNFLPTDEATLRYQYRVNGLGADQLDQALTAGSRTVSGGYLTALRVAILAGDGCPAAPMDSKRPPQALVNRSFNDRFGKGQHLIGRHLRILGTDIAAAYEIVGVVADIREDSARTPAAPYVYACSVAGGWPDPEYVVRTSGDPGSFAGTLRDVVHRIAPDRALFGVETMQDHVDSALEQPRLTAQLLSGFAFTAVTLAACGLYSLCTLLVTTKTREIGTRIALGARTLRVVTDVLARAAKVLCVAVSLGVVLALVAGTLMRSLLFGVSAFDPITFVSVCGLLIFVSLAAMLFPAIRAASIDPVQAIREQ
jgi:putative ABC transport system permease protein